MKKYNILLITSSIDIGGEELSTLSLSKELRRRGYNVYVLLSPTPLVAEFKNNATNVIVDRSIKSRNIWGIIRGAFFIGKLLKKYNIQIIHSQSVVPTMIGYLASKIILARKLVVIWHDRGIKHYRLVRILSNFIVDFIIANSRYEMNKLIKMGFTKGKITFIHNCYNLNFPEKINKDHFLLAEFGIQDSDFVIGGVGRLVP